MRRRKQPASPRSRNSNIDTVAKGVLRQVQAIQQATTPELKDRWATLFATRPPPFSRSYLLSRLIYRVQELAFGALPEATITRLEKLGERLDGGTARTRSLRADDRPVAGTKLVREFRGVEHVVRVSTDGFEYEGRTYQSLSAIARHITGTRWNGPLFFGLRTAGRS